MISKTNLMLFTTALVSISTSIAMDKDLYKMTIDNQLYAKMFLNVPNPDKLTDQSPYPYVKGRSTKTFLLTQEEKDNQSIAISGGHPYDKMQLPIEKKETRFVIKSHPQAAKIILEDDSKKIIHELWILC